MWGKASNFAANIIYKHLIMTMIKHRIDQYMGKIQFRSLLLPTQEPNQTKLISFNLEPILD